MLLLPPPHYVLVGDSIMAGTRNAGWRLQANPLIARNLAGNGYTTRQIANQVTIALNTSSKYVLILAGTNDVINDDFDKDNFLQDYKEMLDLFENSSSIPVVTLIPLTQYREINRRIEIANEEIFKLASTKNIKIIDIKLLSLIIYPKWARFFHPDPAGECPNLSASLSALSTSLSNLFTFSKNKSQNLGVSLQKVVNKNLVKSFSFKIS